MDKTAYFEQMRRKRRTEILSASLKMILKQGVSAFNIQQLARSLDISTVTLYKYFRNIDDIMLALKEQIIEDAFGRLILSVPSSKDRNGLETFLSLIRNFYDEVLKSRDDVTLLLLFEVHTRNIPTSDENAFYAYTEKLNQKMTDLLQMAKNDGSVKSDICVPEAIQFITQMNLAMLQHIGLLSEEYYKKEKPVLLMQIEQLISLFSLYLSK